MRFGVCVCDFYVCYASIIASLFAFVDFFLEKLKVPNKMVSSSSSIFINALYASFTTKFECFFLVGDFCF